MHLLDDLNYIQKLDTQNVYQTLNLLPKQIEQSWEEASQINFDKSSYQKVEKIVFSGMGGSALGAYIVKSLYQNALKVPLEIVNDYHLPSFCDNNTLVFLSSYSGTTEETLACAFEAKAKKALCAGITTGNDLARFLSQNQIPSYIYKPIYNPSKQPRLGIGYSITSFLAMLNKLKLIKVSPKEIEESISILKKQNKNFSLEIKYEKNKVKKIAQKLFKKTPIILSANHLANTGRFLRNQFHETAKSFASFYDLPEANHHLLESLTNPKELKPYVIFLLLESNFYPPRILQRFKITKKVIQQNNLESLNYEAEGKSQISQAFSVVNFGSFLCFYLSMLNNTDPSKIPWVDFFKSELSKLEFNI